ncbi:chromate transporter [Mycoplana sp. BE70]|uniref:chromate transporter n=1 Tax=Mycoplana sp. BE70 TaxID=2817775 RepID=UPI00285644F7|nr:chromate transporter [Mycoplana sp. BE70]MDR6756421.1 chromate transporter [Mycoplana sp. BE70]
MNSSSSALFDFTIHLLLLSLLAIGGINPILPELHRFVVSEHSLLSNEQFVTLFALAQAAPGPNVIFVTLIGWQVYGLVGALVSTAAICGPATVIAYIATGLSERWQSRRWFIILRRSLVPLTTGLMIASAWLLCIAANSSLASYAVTGIVGVLVLATRINPLWLLATAGFAGIIGLV